MFSLSILDTLKIIIIMIMIIKKNKETNKQVTLEVVKLDFASQVKHGHGKNREKINSFLMLVRKRER